MNKGEPPHQIAVGFVRLNQVFGLELLYFLEVGFQASAGNEPKLPQILSDAEQSSTP